MQFERHFAFQNIFIMWKKNPENINKIPGFTSKFRYDRVTLNTGIFYLALVSTCSGVLGTLPTELWRSPYMVVTPSLMSVFTLVFLVEIRKEYKKRVSPREKLTIIRISDQEFIKAACSATETS